MGHQVAGWRAGEWLEEAVGKLQSGLRAPPNMGLICHLKHMWGTGLGACPAHSHPFQVSRLCCSMWFLDACWRRTSSESLHRQGTFGSTAGLPEEKSTDSKAQVHPDNVEFYLMAKKSPPCVLERRLTAKNHSSLYALDKTYRCPHC